MDATAVVLHGTDDPLAVETVQVAEPREGEALVRMVASGMCHTDVSMREVHRETAYPVVLGHEGAGFVDKLGPGVDHVEVGQPVVLSYSSCGTCAACWSGRPGYCETMFNRNFGCQRLDGTTAYELDGARVGSHFFGQSSWASQAVVSARSIVAVDDGAPLDTVGPLGCGIQTGAGAVLNTFQPRPGASIAIFGCGAVGLSALLAAVFAGCETIIGVDLHESRLMLAKDLGASHTIDGRDTVAEEIFAITAGRGVDYTLDTTATAAVTEIAVEALATGGVCGVISAPAPGATAAISPRQLLSGRSIRGIIEGDSVPQVFIPQLLSLHRQGRFPYDELVTRFPVAQAAAAEAASHDGSVIKPVLVF